MVFTIRLTLYYFFTIFQDFFAISVLIFVIFINLSYIRIFDLKID